ncbi:MAG: tRNA (adenosine(37)-N6)-threonylcarbamoyltransferase complex dimerization subunit type 1 TsaB [Prevotellaceae bacterium]|jgi:tRNA threonylcarbamoyladenosine biosynthesis protein TsaB|nr:tRNA (adenosine(37)-N6)-threonylcarbamoyltransferase complex dimerization subunit type 1 TsaB [Prevotellaceae bacterium]
MSVVLCIETSTEVCSASLFEGFEAVVEKNCYQPLSHAVMLPQFLQEIFDFARKNQKLPTAVAVSGGPGSYTGLRIGVSSAKGICFALNIPLIALDTLMIIATEAKKKLTGNTMICPMIDARRMEVYTALFDFELNKIEQTQAKIIYENSFEDLLNTSKIVFCGNGVDKCKGVVKQHPNAVFLENIYPLSSNMIEESKRKFDNRIFEDTAYYEPFYLKEFVATVPKNLI